MDPNVGVGDIDDEADGKPGADGLEYRHRQAVADMHLVVHEEHDERRNAERKHNEQLDAVALLEAVATDEHKAGQQEYAHASLDKSAINANQKKHEYRKRTLKFAVIYI